MQASITARGIVPKIVHYAGIASPRLYINSLSLMSRSNERVECCGDTFKSGEGQMTQVQNACKLVLFGLLAFS